MARTLLELVQAACAEIGIIQPSMLFGSTDDQVIQLLALANREGKDFSQRANGKGGWQVMHKEYTFPTVTLSGITGTTTDLSPIITNINDTSSILPGYGVSCAGLYAIATVVSVDSPTQITVNQAATSTNVGTDLTVGKIAYDFPGDFEYFLNQTFWDGAFRWQLLGPLEAQEKNVIKYGISPVGPRMRFWIIDNQMILNPIPSVNDVIAYDYQSNAWCTSNSGTLQTLWAADDDYYILDEECFILGLKKRFKQAKGFDYAQEEIDYRTACERIMARDGGNRSLPLNASASGLKLLSDQNIPDTGFGM